MFSDSDFEFEVPKFIDLKNLTDVDRCIFTNELIARNLDDLWFTIGHHFHDFTNRKSEKLKSNKKEKKPSKKLKNEEDEEEINQVLGFIKKQQNLKRKNSIKCIPFRENRKEKIFVDKEMEKISHTTTVTFKLGSNENKNKNNNTSFILKNIENAGKNGSVIKERKKLVLTSKGKENQQHEPKSKIIHPFEKGKTSQQNITYVPAIHGTRDIRKVMPFIKFFALFFLFNFFKFFNEIKIFYISGKKKVVKFGMS